AYGTLAALAVASVLLFSRYWRRPRVGVLLGVGLANAAGLYVHYGMLLVVAGEILALAVLARRGTWGRTGGLALALVGTGALHAPWLRVAGDRLAGFAEGQVGTLARVNRLIEIASLPPQAVDLVRDGAFVLGL